MVGNFCGSGLSIRESAIASDGELGEVCEQGRGLFCVVCGGGVVEIFCWSGLNFWVGKFGRWQESPAW